MPEGHTIANIGDLAKPAEALVNRIADAIGVWWSPHQVVRNAHAEAKAELIRSEGRVKIEEIEKRALQRFIREEARAQENIEQIIGMALPQLDAEAPIEDVDADWLFNFFDKCKQISNKDMQRIWAKMLAQEGNAPGAFSRVTVGLMAFFEARDLRLFAEFCAHCVVIAGVPYAMTWKDAELQTNRFTVSEEVISELELMDLILPSQGEFSPPIAPGGQVDILYFDHIIRARNKGIQRTEASATMDVETISGSIQRFRIGDTRLTRVAKELYLLCEPTEIPGFSNHVLRLLRTRAENSGQLDFTAVKRV